MKTFGWVSARCDPPERWDLRRLGWRLCSQCSTAECGHVLIVDACRPALAVPDRHSWRVLLVGVDDPAERSRLLTNGCAEAMASTIGLHELEARATRVEAIFGMLPRYRTVGRVTLDLLHRDARRGSRWLALHPREFKLLWRLADHPGERVSRRQLLADVWRLSHEPETNSVEVHVSRLRAKLAAHGCEGVVLTDPRGGYRLPAIRSIGSGPEQPGADRLDIFFREGGLATCAELAPRGR